VGNDHSGETVERSGDKLSLKTHVTYGVSQFGLNTIGTAFGVNALFFYSTILKFDTVLFGIVLLIGQIWDAITDPIMGYTSDHTTWKHGRRRPYFLLGSIPLGVSFFLVFSPPLLQSNVTIFIYLLMTILILYTSRTVFETPYLALAPELTPDYNERTRLSGFKQFFGTLGDAMGAMVPLLLLTAFHENRRAAHFAYGLIACVTMIALSAVTLWGTFERPNLVRQSKTGIKESLRAVAKNRPYLIFMFSSTAAQMGNNIVTYLVLFLTKYWFLDETLATRFFAVFFAGCICAVPMWVWLSNHIGKKWAYVSTMAGYGLLLSSVLLLRQDARLFATAVMFFAGAFNVGLWVLSGTVAPDIIEWDEYHTGERREGVYASVWTFVYKAGIGLALWVVGTALKFIHFDADLPVQTASTLLGLRILFGPISGMFLFAGALAFLTYPITKSKHEEIRRLIRERQSSGSSV